jgi:hypothetical protein
MSTLVGLLECLVLALLIAFFVWRLYRLMRPHTRHGVLKGTRIEEVHASSKPGNSKAK